VPLAARPVALFAASVQFAICAASCVSTSLIAWSPVEAFCWLALHWSTLRG
jgi:hypothetical protein